MMNQTYTAVLADDEPLLRHHLNKLLAELWPVRKMVKSLCRQLNSISLMWFF